MSLAPAQLLRGLGLLALLAAWAVLAHLASAGDAHPDLATALGIAPLVAIIFMLLWPLLNRSSRLLGAGAALGLIVGLWPSLRQNIALLYYVQHIGTNLALARMALT